MVFLYGKASHQITSDNSLAAKRTAEAEQARRTPVRSHATTA